VSTKPPEFEKALYDRRGEAYRAAWNILADELRTPPSIEVFLDHLKRLREALHGAITPQMAARQFVELSVVNGYKP